MDSFMRYLISINGYIGDIFFASSVADQLIEQGMATEVDLEIPLRQPFFCLNENPNISVVINGLGVAFSSQYDRAIYLGQVDQSIPATIQFQKKAGIPNPTVGYKIYLPEYYDIESKKLVDQVRKDNPGKTIVGVQSNWKEKSFLFTREEYERAIDVPGIGFGKGFRNIDTILDIIRPKMVLLPVGLPMGNPQHLTQDPHQFTSHVGIMKHVDFVIGSEGGITNIAAGLGTSTIITTDFIWQLYGPKGSQRKIDKPQMGPLKYFPNATHAEIGPFQTDEEVGKSILWHTYNDR